MTAALPTRDEVFAEIVRLTVAIRDQALTDDELWDAEERRQKAMRLYVALPVPREAT